MVRIGEPDDGDPSKVWGFGRSPEACRKDLAKRIKQWKPRPIASTDYSDDPTVLELVRAWYAAEEKSANTAKRIQTLSEYYREIEVLDRSRPDTLKIANSKLGAKKAKTVLRKDFRLHFELMASTPVKQARQATILRQAFDWFIADEGRDDNPAAGVKLKRSTGHKRRWKKVTTRKWFADEPEPFTPEEYELYRHLETERVKETRYTGRRYLDFTTTLYAVAGRPSEVMALEFPDIDFDERTVSVGATAVSCLVTRAQADKLIAEFELEPQEYILRSDPASMLPDAQMLISFRQPFPKTDDSRRRIRVSADEIAVLKRRKLEAKPECKFPFATHQGRIMAPGYLDETYRQVVKGTPLEGSTLKTLRSTRATRVVEHYLDLGKDVALARAREILGHGINSPVTNRFYVSIAEAPVIDFAAIG
jgi:integrase